jgi:hypothetical protein
MSSKDNPLEPTFQEFVKWFGGTVLPEAPTGHTADYLFSNYGVIAEFKTLLQDSTAETNAKVTKIVQDWCKENNQLPPGAHEDGQFILRVRDMPLAISDRWVKILLDSVERLVKAANKQIRDTKVREGLPDAKDVIIIGNPKNKYFNDANSYKRLIVETLRKRDRDGNLRFPHVHGAVYFSLGDVKLPDKNMFFWANMGMTRKDDDGTVVMRFLEEFQDGFYRFLSEECGIPVRRHKAEE